MNSSFKDEIDEQVIFQINFDRQVMILDYQSAIGFNIDIFNKYRNNIKFIKYEQNNYNTTFIIKVGLNSNRKQVNLCLRIINQSMFIDEN